MAWQFEAGTPIYRQITDVLLRRICNGTYPAGAELPTVREFAVEFSVNPNTVQKAFAELEATGAVLTHRTAGRSVAKDAALISQIRTRLARKIVADAAAQVRELGGERGEMLQLWEEIGHDSL